MAKAMLVPAVGGGFRAQSPLARLQLWLAALPAWRKIYPLPSKFVHAYAGRITRRSRNGWRTGIIFDMQNIDHPFKERSDASSVQNTAAALLGLLCGHRGIGVSLVPPQGG